jgi:hypothetical protein
VAQWSVPPSHTSYRTTAGTIGLGSEPRNKMFQMSRFWVLEFDLKPPGRPRPRGHPGTST